jgi:hypothetical protein
MDENGEESAHQVHGSSSAIESDPASSSPRQRHSSLKRQHTDIIAYISKFRETWSLPLIDHPRTIWRL